MAGTVAKYKKKITALSLILFLGFACFFLSFNLGGRDDPANILPNDTLALVKIKNFSKTATTIQGAPFGQEIFNPAFDTVLQQLQLSEETFSQIVSGISEFEHLIEHPLFKTFVNRQCSIAILAGSSKKLSFSEYFQQNALLFIDFNIPFNSEFILKKILSDKATINEIKHHDKSFFKVTLNAQGTFYCTLDQGMIVASLLPVVVKRFIDFSKELLIRPKSVLSNSKPYKKYKNKDKKEDFFVYLNIADLYSNKLVSDVFPSLREYRWHNDERLFFDLIIKEEETIISASYENFLLKKQGITSEFKFKQPSENNQIDKLPVVSTFFWTNLLDFDEIWNQLSQAPTLPTATLMFFIAQKVYEHTGVDINVLTAMFGNEVSFFVEDPSLLSSKKIPMICFLFSLRQPGQLKEFFSESLTNVDTVTTTIEGYEGVSLLMAGGLIRPAYLFKNDLLFVADHISLIQKILESDQQQKMLFSEDFKRVGSGFDELNNVLIYSRIDQYNAFLQKISIWGLHILEQENEITALQRDMIIDHLVTPLFESLNGVRSQGIRIYTENNDLMMKAKLFSPK